MTAIDDLESAAVAYAKTLGYALPAPPPPTTGPSGIAIPVDPAGWTRILTEDFTTPVALGAWKSEPNWPNVPGVLQPPGPLSGGTPTMSAYPFGWDGTPKIGEYHPEVTNWVHDGVLDQWLQQASPEDWISAVCPRVPFGQNRLRVLVCTKFPAIPGFHVSFLLWPDDNVWPRDGEIDWPEGDLVPSGVASGFEHLENATTGGDQVKYSPGYILCDGKYHVYGLEWEHGQHVRLWRDNDAGITWTNRTDATAMHYVMQLGVSFAGPPAAGVNGHVLTDWIAVSH